MLKHLRGRGRKGTELFVTDKCQGLLEFVGEGFAQEDRPAALRKAHGVHRKLLAMKLAKASQIMREGIEETLAYMSFPREHWLKIRTTNPLERISRELRRRTRVVGAFPDGTAAVLLVTARLRHMSAPAGHENVPGCETVGKPEGDRRLTGEMFPQGPADEERRAPAIPQPRNWFKPKCGIIWTMPGE